MGHWIRMAMQNSFICVVTLKAFIYKLKPKFLPSDFFAWIV